MLEAVTLPEEVTQQVRQLGPVDFVVGVASQNDGETIAGVMQGAWAGLQRAFPGARVAILHADGGAHDGTAERARAAVPDASMVQVTVPADRRSRGVPALGNRAGALRLIFTLSDLLTARGCAVLDADVTSITPDWVGRLLAPIEAGRAGFVAPCYARARFAGAMTSSVIYPFVRALYGKRIRYPVGGEFGCAAPVCKKYLAADIWEADSRLGIDARLTMRALASGCRVEQAWLGVKTQAPGDALDLSTTLSRVLGALFLEAEGSVAVWQKVRGSEPVPVQGNGRPDAVEAAPIDLKRSLEAFRLGERNLQEIWSPVLPPLARLDLQKLARLPEASFRLPDALWARVVYDFALAYHVRLMNRDHLLAAFAPLYSGWLASFVGEMEDASEAAVEERIEQLCLKYEAEKPYLISRWRWPDRFNP